MRIHTFSQIHAEAHRRELREQARRWRRATVQARPRTGRGARRAW